MDRPRPIRNRLITLVKHNQAYFWTCSECYWHYPMTLAPLDAIHGFDGHKCVEHAEPILEEVVSKTL